METNAVKVKLWGYDVSFLYWDKKAQSAVFEYESSFLEKGVDIAPLTMSINSPRSQKGLPWCGEKGSLYHGLPSMIADSLPDKWGSSLFSAWLRDNNISKKNVTAIDHLAFIGSRAMGALEYEPAHKLGDSSSLSGYVERVLQCAR